MKKVFVLLMTLGLFVTACNNKKADKNPNSNNREKDDYGKNDGKNNSDEKMTDGNTGDNVKENNNTMMSSGWPQAEKDAFITNCVTNATAGGNISRTVAQNYCDCMLNKMETLYPDIRDAGKITEEDMNSPEMVKMAKDCLGVNN